MKNGEENVRSNRRRREKKDQTQQENRFEMCVLEKEKGKNLNKKYIYNKVSKWWWFEWCTKQQNNNINSSVAK